MDSVETVAVPPAAPEAARAGISWRALGVDSLLLLVLLAGGYLRFVGLNWDAYQHLHPDERFLTMVETSISPVRGGWEEYFDTETSSLNPYNRGHGFFVYGTAPIFMVRYVADWIQVLHVDWLNSELDWQAAIARGLVGTTDDPGLLAAFGAGYDQVHLVGRALSALADLLAVWIVYHIGRRLYSDRRIGLLAAALSAVAVLPIQQAHFFTVDAISNVFVASALFFAVRARDDVQWNNYVFFGLALGLAVASRINTAPLALVIALAAFVYSQRGAGGAGPEATDEEEYTIHNTQSCPERSRRNAIRLRQVIVRLAVAAFISLLTFRIAQPYAFAGPSFFDFEFNEQWLGNMREIRGQVSGDVDFPPNHQWANRPALIFPFENMVRWGLGYALGLTAWLGLAVAAWQVLRGRWQRHLITVVWSGLYFGWQGTQWVKPMRYFMPIYPTLILLAAWLLVYLWDRAGGALPAAASEGGSSDMARLAAIGRRFAARLPAVAVPTAAKRGAALLLIALVVALTAAWAFAFSRIYTRPVTRVEASEWILQNVPAPFNVRIEMEAGLFSQPLPMPYDFRYVDGETYEIPFRARATGAVREIVIGHLGDPARDSDPEKFILTLESVSGGRREVLATAVLSRDLSQSADPRGDSVTLRFDAPVNVEEGKEYRLTSIVLEGAPVSVEGAGLINESSWDDGLPLRFDGIDPFGGLYTGYSLELYWEDNESKREMMLENLDRGDYIVISSNRQYGSIPRLPMRYPLTIAYYDALFSGELGFDLVLELESAPTLGSFVISDQTAEETFTVYDHPKVTIFQKSEDFSLENARAILGAVDLSQVIFMNPSQATAAPTALLLPEDRLAEQRAGGTWSDMFDANGLLNRIQPLGVVAWWGLALLMGWALFPITYLALRGLPDKGYGLAKALALLLVAWVTWLLASVRALDFTRGALWLVFAALAVLSAALFWRNRSAMAAWLRANWGYILLVEVLFLAFFAFFLFIRWRNPDLWHPSFGGEKPMDFSYFNAVLRSVSFPPFDPWFAGGYINYYYFGFVVVAVLTKMLGIVPAFAYNLILPLWFALAATGAFCVAYNLVAYAIRNTEYAIRNTIKRPSPIIAGIAAALLMVVLGNLGELDTLYKALALVTPDVQAAPIPVIRELHRAAVGLYRIVAQGQTIPIGTGQWYWNATRIIPTDGGETMPITEFPFFTFIYADLHAHMIALPLTLLAMGWALSVVYRARRKQGWAEAIAHWAVGGLAIGVLGPTNTWDLPTYLALGAVALVYAELRRRRRIDFDMLIGAGWRIALLVVLAGAFFLPYSQWYGAGYGVVELWKGSTTPLIPYLKIHGLFLFLIVTFLLLETRRWMQRTTLDELEELADLLLPALVVVSAFILMVVVLWTQFDIKIAPLVLPLIAWTALLMLQPQQMPERRALLGLVGLGLTLTLMVELIRLEGDINRMNTVFKFYLQVWTMFSVAAGAALAWAWPQLRDWKPNNARLWQAGLVGLVVMAGLYTVLAGTAKMRDRMATEAPATLDGMAYMQFAEYHDQGKPIPLGPDYLAIRWLQDNVVGSPVIVEVNTTEYKYGSRYTINTGLPGVVGWNWHQRQQRAVTPPNLVTDRVAEIQRFYSTTDIYEALNFLQHYDVRYVIVGGYERAYYPEPALAKFDAMATNGMLEVAYENGDTVIYEVP